MRTDYILRVGEKEKMQEEEEMENSEDGSMFWTWKTIPSSTLSPLFDYTQKSYLLIFFRKDTMKSWDWHSDGFVYPLVEDTCV